MENVDGRKTNSMRHVQYAYDNNNDHLLTFCRADPAQESFWFSLGLPIESLARSAARGAAGHCDPGLHESRDEASLAYLR